MPVTATSARAGRRHIPLGIEFAAICLSLMAIGAWFNIVGYSPVFIAQDGFVTDSEAARYAYYVGRILISALFVCFPAFFERGYAALRHSMPLLLLFGTLLYMLAYNQTLLSPIVIGIAATFIAAIGYMWLDATLYIIAARRFAPGMLVALVMASQVLEQMVTVLMNGLTDAMFKAAIAIAAPLVPLVALFFFDLSAKRGTAFYEPMTGTARRHLLLLFASSGIAIVALGAVSTVGAWGALRADYTPTASDALPRNAVSCAIACLLAWLTLGKSGQRPVSYRYQLGFLAISWSLLFALCSDAILGDTAGADEVVLTGVEYYAHILFWVIACQGVGSVADGPYRVVGVGMLPYSIFSLLWIVVFSIGGQASSAMTFLLACATIAVSAVHPRLVYESNLHLFTKKRDLNEYGISGEPYIPVERNGISAKEAIEKRARVIGEQYGLTARETDVLMLLAQGRSKVVICNTLTLSEGTVKTHTAHIFSKLKVNTIQQLLDVIYETELSASAKS